MPLAPDARRVQLLQRIGSITFGSHGGLVPASLQVLATGAALSPDGTLLAVRTYTDAYLWPVRHGDVAAAIRHRPTRIAIPLQPQGEGICFDAGCAGPGLGRTGECGVSRAVAHLSPAVDCEHGPPVDPERAAFGPPASTAIAESLGDALPYIVVGRDRRGRTRFRGFAVWRRRGRE